MNLNYDEMGCALSYCVLMGNSSSGASPAKSVAKPAAKPAKGGDDFDDMFGKYELKYITYEIHISVICCEYK